MVLFIEDNGIKYSVNRAILSLANAFLQFILTTVSPHCRRLGNACRDRNRFSAMDIDPVEIDSVEMNPYSNHVTR